MLYLGNDGSMFEGFTENVIHYAHVYEGPKLTITLGSTPHPG